MLALAVSPGSALALGAQTAGAQFPRQVSPSARLSVRVTIPSRLLGTTFSLQQQEPSRWKTRAQQRPRRAGVLTLSYTAPATAGSLLLRIRATRSGRLIWGSKYTQVSVRLPSTQSSGCTGSQTAPSSLCGALSSATPTVSPETPGTSSSPAPTVAMPSWWNGECDSGNHPGSFPLGARWNGLVACGPQPAAEDAADYTVRFFEGAWGEYEWECVELSMRWLYLAYGVHPYEADGYDIVDNYSPSDGGGLEKISNDTPGQAPQPGDVLERPAEDHTSVVTATSVNAEGNGSITVIQQNAGSSGWGTYTVSDWNVEGTSDWLHRP